MAEFGPVRTEVDNALKPVWDGQKSAADALRDAKQKVDAIRNSPYKDRFRVFANVNWEGDGGPGWKEKAMADLEQSVKNGAIGL